MNKFIPLSVPSFQGNEKKYVLEAVETEWVSTAGQFVNQFEKDFGNYLNISNAVACQSGTAALHISLIEAGVGLGDEVIVPTVTFIAPINAVKYVGAEPVFMDCDDYLNIDVQKVEEFLERECEFNKDGNLINKTSKKNVKAIIPVHIFGHPVDLERLIPITEKYKLIIIEDATESLGSKYIAGKLQGKQTGTIGFTGCFSFNGNKIITTGGGGMIVTNNQKSAEHMKYLTTQAKDDEINYIHNEIGYNYRMTNLQAALGVAQLENLDKYVEIKRKNFQLYYNELNNFKGLSFIQEPNYALSNYWFYSLVVDEKSCGFNRIDLQQKFTENKIQTRPLWYLNHLQKPYQKNQAYKIEKALKYYAQILNLPCSINLNISQINLVKEILRRI